MADNSYAIKRLNWMPKKSLKDICRDTWNWAFKNEVKINESNK